MNEIQRRLNGFVFARGNGVSVFCAAVLLIMVSRVPIAQADSPHSKRPDVLFIAIEDISPQRFGCYGNYLCKTPTIDQFAKEGLLFTNAHCSAAACNPSRTTLLTGLRPDVSGVYSNQISWKTKLPNVKTMPIYFRDSGYETIRIGKIFHHGADDPAAWTRVIKEDEGFPPAPVADTRSYTQVERQFLFGPSGLDDLEEVDGRASFNAARVLREKRDAPLFLALGFHRPHVPFVAPDKYFEMYDVDNIKLPLDYKIDNQDIPLPAPNSANAQMTPDIHKGAIAAQFACLTFIDACIGRVLDALHEAGREQDTIVVIWSDHGWQQGERGKWRKVELYEESTRVALLIRAPGYTKPGTRCSRPVESVDIFPTLLDLCGVEVPDRINGISMKPLLVDPERPWRKGAVIFKTGDDARSIVTDRYRYTEYDQPRNEKYTRELYDHETDPGEHTNLCLDRQYDELMKQLSSLLNGGWKATLPDGVEL